jgi:diguanylate cyclase (GGDEF)-like protein
MRRPNGRAKIGVRHSAAPHGREAGEIEYAASIVSGDDAGARWTGRLLRLAHELALAGRPSRAAELATSALAELTDGGLAAVFRAQNGAARGLAALAGQRGGDSLRGVPHVVTRAAGATGPERAKPSELTDLGARGCPSTAALAAPVSWNGELLAVLLVAVPETGQLSLHPQLVATVADLLASSLANALRVAGGADDGRLDPLTKLPNHRAFHEHLDVSLRRSLAEDRPLALVLLDVNGLSRLVDERGRDAGDSALRELARAASAVRHAAAFRIGGDEFALALEADSDEAARAGAAVANALAAGTGGLATASAGVATFPVDARTKDELLHQADLALHAAKRAGRGRPVAASSELEGAAGRSRTEVRRARLHGLMASKPVRDAVVDELGALASSMRALGHETSAQALLEVAAGQVRTLLGATACVLSRLDGDTLRDAAVDAPPPWTADPSAGYLLDDYPLTRDAIEAGEPRFASLADPNVDPSEAYVLRACGMQANLMLPLHVDGRPWGLVEIFDARPREFGSGDVALAELVVGQIESLLARLEQAQAVQRLYHETLGSLSNALEAKDAYTSDHTQAVGDLAVGVARRLGLEGDALNAVQFGALLHDIGKIRIPESILNKPGPLGDAEWVVMRSHPEAGERILAPIASLAPVLPIVRSSHERWDGDGYPDRLAGEAIPLGARIVSVCDAYRAMIEPRPYRDARDPAIARAALVASSGTQFDPECVDALLDELEERERVPGVLTLNRPDHLRPG